MLSWLSVKVLPQKRPPVLEIVVRLFQLGIRFVGFAEVNTVLLQKEKHQVQKVGFCSPRRD